MTLTHDSNFDLGAYVKLVESFWDGQTSQAAFEQAALAMGADVETVQTVISNMRQMDGIES